MCPPLTCFLFLLFYYSGIFIYLLMGCLMIDVCDVQYGPSTSLLRERQIKAYFCHF